MSVIKDITPDQAKKLAGEILAYYCESVEAGQTCRLNCNIGLIDSFWEPVSFLYGIVKFTAFFQVKDCGYNFHIRNESQQWELRIPVKVDNSLHILKPRINRENE